MGGTVNVRVWPNSPSIFGQPNDVDDDGQQQQNRVEDESDCICEKVFDHVPATVDGSSNQLGL